MSSNTRHNFHRVPGIWSQNRLAEQKEEAQRMDKAGYIFAENVARESARHSVT